MNERPERAIPTTPDDPSGNSAAPNSRTADDYGDDNTNSENLRQRAEQSRETAQASRGTTGAGVGAGGTSMNNEALAQPQDRH